MIYMMIVNNCCQFYQLDNPGTESAYENNFEKCEAHMSLHQMQDNSVILL